MDASLVRMRDTSSASLVFQVVALVLFVITPIFNAHSIDATWGVADMTVVTTSQLSTLCRITFGATACCYRTIFSLTSTSSAVVPGTCSMLPASAFDYSGSQLSNWFSNYAANADTAFNQGQIFLTDAINFQAAGAGCYYFLIAANIVMLGLSIVSTALTLYKLRVSAVKPASDVLSAGCCGCGCGTNESGLSNPCATLVIVSVAWGVSVPIALISWPTTMSLVLQAIKNWAVQSSAVVLDYSGVITESYTLSAGYYLNVAAVGAQMIALIFTCVSRDAHRSYVIAESPMTSVVTVNPAGGFSAPTPHAQSFEFATLPVLSQTQIVVPPPPSFSPSLPPPAPPGAVISLEPN